MRSTFNGAAALLAAAWAMPSTAADYSFATDVVPAGQADFSIGGSYFKLARSLTISGFPGVTIDEDYKVVEESAQLRVGLGGDWHVGADFAYASTHEDAYSFNGNTFFTDKTGERYQNLNLWVKRRFINDAGFSLSAIAGAVPNTSGKYDAAYYGTLDMGWTLTPASRVFVEYAPYITDHSRFRNQHAVSAGAWLSAEPWIFVPEVYYRYFEKADPVGSEGEAGLSLAIRGHVSADTYITPSLGYAWYGPFDDGTIHYEASHSGWFAGLHLYHVFGAPD